MEATYVVDDKAYDVAKLSAEGQKAFQPVERCAPVRRYLVEH